MARERLSVRVEIDVIFFLLSAISLNCCIHIGWLADLAGSQKVEVDKFDLGSVCHSKNTTQVPGGTIKLKVKNSHTTDERDTWNFNKENT